MRPKRIPAFADLCDASRVWIEPLNYTYYVIAVIVSSDLLCFADVYNVKTRRQKNILFRVVN
jgi:hypothetical protein